MKKIIAVCLVLLSLVLVLAGCRDSESKPSSESSAPVSSTPQRDTKEAAQKIFTKALKSEEAIYFDTSETPVLLKDSAYMKDDSLELSIRSFAVVDFDGDGIPELVLIRKPDDNRLVLQYRNEKVYATMRTLRGMNELKNDGSFYASDSAAHTEIQRLYFELGEFGTAVLASAIDGKYNVDYKEATQSEYEVCDKEQEEKPDVKWYEYLEDTVETPDFIGRFK